MKKIIEYLKLLYNKYKFAIYSSVIFSFITHVYFFIRRLGNEDDLNFISFASSTLTSGRWTTGSLFTGSMLAPMIKFAFVIIVIVFVSVMICDLFNFKSKSSMILTSIILSTFPSLSISFGYLFMVEIYMSALLLAVLGVYVCVKFKYGFLIAGLFIAVSLGNYQSYVGVASALSILYLIKMVFDKKNTKEIIIMFLKLLFMGVLGAILYFVILNVYLRYYNVSLSNYKGANSMGIPPLSQWTKLLYRTYLHYVGYFLGFSFFKSPKVFVVFRLILVLVTFISMIGIIVDKKIYKNKFNIILLLGFIIFLPLAVNIVDFMAYQTEVSPLNIYQFVLSYIICIYIIEIFCSKGGNKINYYIYMASLICFISIGWQNFGLTNSYYYKIEKLNQYTESFNTRLLARIESTEGYDYDMPIMITGLKDSKFYNMLFDLADWSQIINYDQGLWGKFIGYADLYYFDNDAKIIKYINNQFGVQLISVSEEQRISLYKTVDYQNLKAWPSTESVKIIDDVLVIKM